MFKKLKPTMKWIVYDDNPVMKQPIQDVEFPLNETDNEYISKMVSYVDASYYNEANKYNIRPGIGIAAIQLGYPKKIIYIHLDDENGIEHKYLLANPIITKKSMNNAFLSTGEGCLSVNQDVMGYVIRKEIVVVEAFDLFKNEKIQIKADGLLSICLQHEIDHNNNLFYYDSINKKEPFYFDEKWKKI